METINTTSRIHPLMMAAALSVITVSLVGTAAITGLLPSSKADTATPVAALPVAALMAAPAPTAQQLADAQMMVAKYSPAQVQAEPAPVAEAKPVAVKRAQPRPAPRATRVVYRDAPRATRVVYRDAPSYRAQPVQQQAAQPNYLGIGAGAVVGGLIGNQIGGGNGKKLATVAGMIGGGMLGNEIANRNK